MRLLVTGGSGYIGRRCIARAQARGHEVTAAGRQPVPGVTRHSFDLAAPVPPPVPADLDAIVHLAAQTNAASAIIDELPAARVLISLAGSAGARLIFVSSQVARPDAPTAYGRNKWQIEREVLAAGGFVVRPGLVYGGPERGLFGVLVRLVRRLPLLPAFVPAPQIQPIHVDDLAEALVMLAVRDDLTPRIYALGAPEPVSFTTFLRRVATWRVEGARLFVPVPQLAVRLVAAVVGSRLADRLGLNRLLSLFSTPPMPGAEADLAAIGLHLRSIESGVARSGDGQRRRLIAEGRAMLTYLLGERPALGLVRRYVRMVERLRGRQPVRLPALFRQRPLTLGLIDRRAVARTEFGWRIEAATSVAEASPQGAHLFLGTSAARRPLRAAAGIFAVLCVEAALRLVAFLSAPILPRGSRLEADDSRF